jgi:hypothetical protein
MDIKELIEKAFAVGHTIGYGNTENHYKPEFERWWNDETTQEQVKNCSIPDVGQRFYHFDSWNRKGYMYETEVVEAFNQSDAIVLFKSRFPDRGFDSPY